MILKEYVTFDASMGQLSYIVLRIVCNKSLYSLTLSLQRTEVCFMEILQGSRHCIMDYASFCTSQALFWSSN